MAPKRRPITVKRKGDKPALREERNRKLREQRIAQRDAGGPVRGLMQEETMAQPERMGSRSASNKKAEPTPTYDPSQCAFPSLDPSTTLLEQAKELGRQKLAEIEALLAEEGRSITSESDEEGYQDDNPFDNNKDNPFPSNKNNYFGKDEEPDLGFGFGNQSGVARPKPPALKPVDVKYRGTNCAQIGDRLVNVLDEVAPGNSSSRKALAPATGGSYTYPTGSGYPTLNKETASLNPFTGQTNTRQAVEAPPDRQLRTLSINNSISSNGEDADEPQLYALRSDRAEYHIPRSQIISPFLEEVIAYNKMTENMEPGTGGPEHQARGMAYYERLKKDIKQTIKDKQASDEKLAKIEQAIWEHENAYLEDTGAGNIMKGFDNYIKASGTSGGATGGGTASRKKSTVGEQDRVFSRSSVGFWNSMQEGSPHASATSTPSHAATPRGLSDHPTPTSTTSTRAPGLKKKKVTDQAQAGDDSDGKPSNKRLKITFNGSNKDA